MSLFFDTAIIIGVGLIGGSMARIFKAKKLAGKILGAARSEETLRKAKDRGIIDARIDEGREIEGATLVVLATPLGMMTKSFEQIAPSLPRGTIVTDVGSVKASLVRLLERLMPEGVTFVGGHPIAGSEKSGVDASRDDLFLNRLCILTPTPATDRKSLAKIEELWHVLGCRVAVMEPEEHDRTFAAVSHLPQIVAYTLVNAVKELERGEKSFLDFAGGGFRDTTRIAASHPEMWRDICLFNKDEILKALEQFESTLKSVKGLLSQGNLQELEKEFLRAKEARETLQ